MECFFLLEHLYWIKIDDIRYLFSTDFKPEQYQICNSEHNSLKLSTWNVQTVITNILKKRRWGFILFRWVLLAPGCCSIVPSFGKTACSSSDPWLYWQLIRPGGAGNICTDPSKPGPASPELLHGCNILCCKGQKGVGSEEGWLEEENDVTMRRRSAWMRPLMGSQWSCCRMDVMDMSGWVPEERSLMERFLKNPKKKESCSRRAGKWRDWQLEWPQCEGSGGSSPDVA